MTVNSIETVPGLSAPVDLWRDAFGIPHAKATTSDDAFFALGFIHATDRLWQMDAMRRRVLGRYAEHVGPIAVPMDQMVRRLGIAECSRRDLAAAAPATRAMLSAYAAGVNAFIATGKLSIEYQRLGETPELWEDWHSIAVQRQTGLVLTTAYTKLWRAIALPVLGPDAIDKLRMDGGGDEELVINPPGEFVRRLEPDLAALGDAIAALLQDSPADATGGGSNNWVLSGNRTKSGRPLLAGDPHRGIDMPNMYLQCHIACDEFDVVGITSPGVPGFPHFAHNENVAWGVTIAFVDFVDVYTERFSPDAKRYLKHANADGSGEEWTDVEHHVETIKVRGAAPVTFDIFRTARGPVLAGDPRSGKALVVRHAADVETDHALDCMLPMMKATSVAELYEAVRGWGLVDHNLVSADAAGHIGHRVRARVPERSAANGWLPVPGWLKEHAWRGWIPFEKMPEQIDPPAGLIVTANNRVVGKHPYYLCTDAHPPHRARRIWDRLTSIEKADVADMESVHRDSVSIPGLEMCALLADLKITDPAAAELRDRLVMWDGQMLATSVEADRYVSLRLELVRILAARSGLAGLSLDGKMIPPGIGIETQLNWCLPHLLRENDASWLRGRSWDDVLLEALSKVAQQPEGVWGDRHRFVLIHQLGEQFPDEPAFKSRDKGPVDGDHETVFATAYAPHLGLNTNIASVVRYVFDVGNWDASRWIVFHGVSGDPHDPHYDDQCESWRRGETIPMQYSWDGIAASAASHTVLKP